MSKMKNNLLIILAILLFGLSCSKENPTPIQTNLVTQGLVGYWSFDNNVFDGTANENHGQNFGGSFVNDRNGNKESAIEFTGNGEYVVVPHSNSIDFETDDEYSICLWAKVPPSQNNTNRVDNDLISKWVETGVSTDATGYSISLRVFNQAANSAEHTIGFGRWDSDIGGCSTGVRLNTVEQVNDNEFRFYTMRMRNDTMELFVNGSLTSQAKDSLECQTENTAPLYFGVRRDVGTQNPFEGVIDEVRIYDRAISDSEINEIYNE